MRMGELIACRSRAGRVRLTGDGQKGSVGIMYALRYEMDKRQTGRVG